jgi:hypothetical protein
MMHAAPAVLEHSMQVCERSIEVCKHAEAVAWELLARTDRYGTATADVVRWEELLEWVADVHVRVRALKVRFSATHGASRAGAGAGSPTSSSEHLASK